MRRNTHEPQDKAPDAEDPARRGRNPEVYAQGTRTEQAALCTALVAAICMDYPDPAGMLISMMTTAADLMDRSEVVHDEET